MWVFCVSLWLYILHILLVFIGGGIYNKCVVVWSRQFFYSLGGCFVISGMLWCVFGLFDSCTLVAA